MLIPIGVVRYPIYRFLTYVGCTVALLALGIISATDDLADRRRFKLSLKPGDVQGRKLFDSGRGALIFANHQGFIDVLLLGLKLSPIFVFPASDGTPVQFSLTGALRRAATRKEEVAPKSVTLEDIMANGRSSFQPVVVFPEGMRTTGKCVLTWKDATFKGITEFKPDTGILSIKYVESHYPYTPQHTVGSMSSHTFWLCCQLPQKAAIMWLPTKDFPEAMKAVTDKEKPFEKVRSLLITLASAGDVKIGADMHFKFMEYWDESQKKGYTDKKKR
jgi:hypothetical protein